MRRPHHTLAAAILLTGILAWLAPNPPHIEPGQAALHEGRDVVMQGVVVSAITWSDSSKFVVAHAGQAIDVRFDGTPPGLGAWVRAEGSLRRLDGALLLWADDWQLDEAPTAQTVPLASIARDPVAWLNQHLSLQADMGKDLRDGQHRLQYTGAKSTGPVVVTGALGYDARCSCYVFHVDRVQPWTR